VWNSTDERHRRIIWRCNGKYLAKGEKGCESRHIDDEVLYQAFINTFNALIENKDYFMEKWQERLGSDNLLQRYKARQFIGIIMEAEPIIEFDIDLYFALVEKIMVYDGGRLIVSLLDGTDVECEMNRYRYKGKCRFKVHKKSIVKMKNHLRAITKRSPPFYATENRQCIDYEINEAK
jgi:site-specific DNA recombinase